MRVIIKFVPDVIVFRARLAAIAIIVLVVITGLLFNLFLWSLFRAWRFALCVLIDMRSLLQIEHAAVTLPTIITALKNLISS